MMQKRIQNRSIQVGLRNQPEDGHTIVGFHNPIRNPIGFNMKKITG